MDSLEHTDWLRLLAARTGPRYLAIVDELAAALNRGELGSGTRLPPQRELAQVLAVDVTTVSRAMREAQRRGLVVARGRAGTFLTVPVRASVTAEGADLSVNYPPPLPAGLQDSFWETAASIARRVGADALLDYPRQGWTHRQSEAGAQWCAGVGLAVGEERVTLAGGAQQALVGLASLLCEPGDIVITGGLTYPGMISVARRAGLRVVGVELDAEGLIPEALEQACRRLQPKMVYVVPTFQNPTTATASANRRSRIAEVIAGAGAWLVEDDGHAALLEGAPPPISAHIPERSYYVSSISKPVSPGLRTAYVVAPSARDAERLTRSLFSLGQFPAPIVVEITTEWITGGQAMSAVSAMRQSAAERWDIARALLPQLRAGAAFTNHFGWLPLPAGWQAESFAERARARGVRVSPSSAFAVAARFAKPGLRVCLGAAPTLPQLSQSLEVLSDVLREDPLLNRPVY